MKNIFSLLLLLIGAYEANCQIITTIAGTGSGTYGGDGGPASAAALYYPRNVGTDRNGNLYISDMRNSRVRRINYAQLQGKENQCNRNYCHNSRQW